jgi:protein phosphatase PTC7
MITDSCPISLWSRLLLHFWALEVERHADLGNALDPVGYLQSAYEATLRATKSPTEWLGTTTSATAILHHTKEQDGTKKPLLYVTNLGDCKILVIRPSEEKVIFRTAEQWHWFDCPMQLGTNSIDTPKKDAVLSKIVLQEDDIILALSDGVMDNLWEHEVLKVILDSVNNWEEGRVSHEDVPNSRFSDERNVFVARELLNAALTIAQDPFAESPFMEKAIDEGLAIEGGKMDDISVVIASCKKRAG